MWKKYALAEGLQCLASPIQRRRNLIKSGSMPALSSKTIAQSLPEWEVKRTISSLIKSGWQDFAPAWSTCYILLPVRYLTMPCLFTKMPIGWLSNRPSLLARRKILYADWTGQIWECLSSAANVIHCPFCQFIYILIVIFNFLGWSRIKSGSLSAHLHTDNVWAVEQGVVISLAFLM